MSKTANKLSSKAPAKKRDAASADIAAALHGILADTFVLYMKTHGAHWNIEGPNFHSLHLLFEGQYNELWLALDPLAERIRALGDYAPHSFAEILKRAALKECKGGGKPAEMLDDLLKSQESLVANLHKAARLAQEAGDEVSAGMLLARIEVHDKQAWMLRASLK
ncbi:MAG: DNA starvation/stationary phase protection protein [Gammaproteobacteria bacterium]|nr:DNA starvation/stationary phase protection protein [Gammaproteobacteria bacterium]